MRLTTILVAMLCACGGNHGAHSDARGGGDDDGGVVDALPDAEVCVPITAPPSCGPTTPPTTAATGNATCNPLAQTGCTTGQKCTWIVDSITPTSLGHVGCTPNGTVDDGCACSVGAPGATGFDDCKAGDACVSGTCKAICDLEGGAPVCGTRYGCGAYAQLFDTGGGATAGVCDPRCDPLTENDFVGSGSKPGCICGSARGCYAFPGTSQPTDFKCSAALNPTLVQRTACTVAAGCAPSSSSVYLNGCAQGYIPLLDDQTGSSQAVCIAYCSPGNTYMGNPGTQHPAGREPHACNTLDARGTFNPATTTPNGDHCFFSWAFEYDSQGNFVQSPTSNSVGFCVDHTKYRYDSNNDGMTDTNDLVWPTCASLGVGSNVNGGFDATFFGCIDTTTATALGSPPAANRTQRQQLPLRLPYHALVKQ